MRVADEPAFVLHHHDYGETSLLLEMFSRQHGRLGLIAKGARRPKSPLRATLIPFQMLAVNFSGRGELPTLSNAESLAPAALLTGEALYCGLYLNELLMRLLHRHDPHEGLFQGYADALQGLATSANLESALRLFEKRLLDEIGYGLVLDHSVDDGRPVQAEAHYRYLPERGPVAAKAGDDGIPVSGRSLLALAREQLDDETVRHEAKRLLRALLARQLGTRPLLSRRLFGPVRAVDTLE